MLPIRFKLLWAGVILFCAALLPWHVGFAGVSDQQIQAAKEYHILLVNQFIPQDYQAPNQHLVYLQTLINDQYEQRDKLGDIAFQLLKNDFDLINNDVIYNIQMVVEYLQNPPVPVDVDELIRMLPSTSKYIQGEVTPNKLQKLEILLRNIQIVMSKKHPSVDIISMDLIHDKDGLNSLYQYLQIPLFDTCLIY